MSIIFNSVTFGYNGPLLTGINCHCDRGWTAVVGPNGCGKTTLLLLAAGKLAPLTGTVHGNDRNHYCAQKTDTQPEHFEEFLFAGDSMSGKLKGILKIEEDWNNRWETLSFGERKRAQVATALWLEPAVLIVDEPTNHLDAAAGKMLKQALKRYNGTGILVSHDRSLLHNLPYQCLFIENGNAVMRPGNYSQGEREQQLEEEHARKQKKTINKNITRLHRQASVRRSKASQANRQRSKRSISKKDHDAKSKIDLARVSGKDGVEGKLLNQLQGRIRHEEDKLKNINVKKRRQVRYTLPTEASQGNVIISLEEGSIPVGQHPLRHGPLTIRPGDRIALTGPNGSGKTTLINFLVPRITGKKVLYLPQETGFADTERFLDEIKNLPDDKKGDVYTVVGSLGSEPKRLLNSAAPSPGELRKLMLARGILERPHIIIMDEPTNHMDLPSVRCLEETLQESESALLLVSHDRFFLDVLAELEWEIVADQDTGCFKLVQDYYHKQTGE